MSTDSHTATEPRLETGTSKEVTDQSCTRKEVTDQSTASKEVTDQSCTRKEVTDQSTASYKHVTKEVKFQPIREGENIPADPVAWQQSARPKSQSPTPKSAPGLHFYSGNPSVEKVKGILHIYKDK